MFESMFYEVKKSFKDKYKYVLKDGKIRYFELDDKFKMKKIDEYKDKEHSIALYDEMIKYYKNNNPESFETVFDEKNYIIDFYYAKQIRNGEKIKTVTFNAKYNNKKDFNQSKKLICKLTKKTLKRK